MKEKEKEKEERRKEGREGVEEWVKECDRLKERDSFVYEWMEYLSI